MQKTALITGITGQDSSYLSEFLLEKNYKVYGIQRRCSSPNTTRLNLSLINKNFELVEGDVCDPFSLGKLVSEIKPDEFYNLAAQSHVKTSFEQPVYTFQANAIGALNCLEAIRTYSPTTRFYQASTSEMFGSNMNYPSIPNWQIATEQTENKYKAYQDESTPFSPNSPYAVSKLAAHQLVINYRKSYGLYGVCGILFNHESPRRGELFVTRKITRWIAEFRRWRRSIDGLYVEEGDYLVSRDGSSFPKLRLGNLDAQRDWGHARDYVEGMWAMLQQDMPDDYVLATGETHSIRDFLTEAFNCVMIEDWSDYVVVDPKFYRPCEVEYLLGNPQKAQNMLGWKAKTTFKELVQEMVEHDYKNYKE